MALFEGTTGTDTLIGTSGDDVLRPMGTTVGGDREVLRGLNGADTYDLQRNATATIYNFLIDDRGIDGAVDAITNAGPMYQSASLGYVGYASAEHVGDDLVIHLPHKPHRFRDPAKPSYDIRIKDHFSDAPVETLEAGGVVYNLITGAVGTAVEDIMAGTRLADDFTAGGGDDWVFGNGGRDLLNSGAGDDHVFGGKGGDTIRAGTGNDVIFGGGARDKIRAGDGGDRVEGGGGNDVIRGGAGGDRLGGGDGDDRLLGQDGQDYLNGGAGDEVLIGGREGDVYRFHTRASDAGFGHDVIRDNGNKPSYLNTDIIELSGLYGPSDGNRDEAYARMSFARDGDDMVIVLDGGRSSIRVESALIVSNRKFDIETLKLNAGYWSPLIFDIISAGHDAIGDDRDAVNGSYGGRVNEVIIGSDGDDQIYGDAGTNFIWTGAGADVLIYKENDPENLFGYGGGLSNDIVEDFDVTRDKLDFSEIASIGSRASLTISEDADGDAIIYWASGDFEVSSIRIELRGVSAADLHDDMFVFV